MLTFKLMWNEKKEETKIGGKTVIFDEWKRCIKENYYYLFICIKRIHQRCRRHNFFFLLLFLALSCFPNCISANFTPPPWQVSVSQQQKNCMMFHTLFTYASDVTRKEWGKGKAYRRARIKTINKFIMIVSHREKKGRALKSYPEGSKATYIPLWSRRVSVWRVSGGIEIRKDTGRFCTAVTNRTAFAHVTGRLTYNAGRPCLVQLCR